MLIFLVGFMGSGKSTVGRELSRILQYEFNDLDSLIENGSGLTISQWFELNGEKSFREYESGILKGLNTDSSKVIATGGGTPCFHSNMEWMQKNGVTVYLKMDELSLFHRLKMARRPRPLLEGMNDDEMLDFIRLKLNERKPLLESSRIMVRGENANVQELADRLQVLSGDLN